MITNKDKIFNSISMNHTETLIGMTDSKQLELITDMNAHLKRYMLILDFSDDDKTYEALKKSAPEILIMLNDTDRLHEYYNNYMKKLTDNTSIADANELIMTLETFTEYSGDYEESAKALHLHINTVRYRINKIRRYFNLEDNIILFHEKASILIRVKRMIEKAAAEKQAVS